MDPLAWLGLKRSASRQTLAAVHDVVREMMPDDEPVVLRYIVVVAVLLAHVANADGGVQECELVQLRMLFQHIDRFPPQGIEVLCQTLNSHASELEEDELELCIRELKSLCDAQERLQVVRLLASLAAAGGEIPPAQAAVLRKIASSLGVAEPALDVLLEEAMSGEPPLALPSSVQIAVEPEGDYD